MRRDVFLAAGSAAVDLLTHPAVMERWDDPSALERMTVGALAGHLSRSILQVEYYLDAPVPDVAPIDAAAYYLRLDAPDDLDSDLNTAVRRRASEASAEGPATTAETALACLDRLRSRLPVEPADRLVEAFGSVLKLDDYLETRLVEMAVHHDDLRSSIGVEVPDLPEEAIAIATGVMLEVATRHHGPRAVLTALTRRERDTVNALRVL
jgi:hypothetical protein